MALRLTQLYQSLPSQRPDHHPKTDAVGRSLPPRSPNGTLVPSRSPSGIERQPDIAIEASTAFGKVTISNATFDHIGNAFSNLITNAACHIAATKEKMGLRTLTSIQAEQLRQSGVLDGE